MLVYWTNMTPKIAAKELVANLVRRFSMKENMAWIAVARFRNHQHTEAQ